MNKATKSVLAGLATIAVGFPAVYGFYEAWDAIHGPRWAWIWELQAAADELKRNVEVIKDDADKQDYELQLLRLQVVEDTIVNLRVQIDGYQRDHQIAPMIVVQALEDKQNERDRINRRLTDLEQK